MDTGQITVQERSGVSVAALTGEHDLSTAAQVDDALRAVHGGLVIDLGGTTFIDSSILGVLLAAARTAEQDGKPFAVVLPADSSSPVRRLFDLTGLNAALPLATDVEGAVTAARSHA